MCHLILLMPLLTLPIFWLVPLSIAIPIYIAIVMMSVLFYWLVMKTMTKPATVGAESLIGSAAEVVSRLKTRSRAQYLVKMGGEIWSARSPDVLYPGETATITAIDGVRLIVARNSSNSTSIKQVGVTVNGRNCH